MSGSNNFGFNQWLGVTGFRVETSGIKRLTLGGGTRSTFKRSRSDTTRVHGWNHGYALPIFYTVPLTARRLSGISPPPSTITSRSRNHHIHQTPPTINPSRIRTGHPTSEDIKFEGVSFLGHLFHCLTFFRAHAWTASPGIPSARSSTLWLSFVSSGVLPDGGGMLGASPRSPRNLIDSHSSTCTI